MKQLKFMLAAATAIGLATVVQADPFNGSTDFESSPLVSVDGIFPSLPENAAEDLEEEYNRWEVPDDNFSTLVDSDSFGGKSSPKQYASGSHAKALNVDVGIGTLVRHIENDGNGATVKDGTVYIDTMVQFTVTPDEAEPTPGGEDKLMLYAKEVTNSEGNPVINLHVVTSEFSVDELEGIYNYTTNWCDTGVPVSKDTWYRLTVKSTALSSIANQDDKINLFEIYVDGVQVDAGRNLVGMKGAESSKFFPSIQGVTKTAGIKAVGFSGEGMVDDLVFTTEYPFEASTVDFTLDLGEGVSAVSWTVNGETQNTAGGKFTAASDVSSLYVAISSVTYESGYAGTQDWTTYTYEDTKSGSVEITAKKFADVSEGVVTPTHETVAAVTSGPFKVPEATDDNTDVVAAAKADLAKALTWATSKGGKSYDDAISTIKSMNFETTALSKTEEAYLLNCAPTDEAIGEKKDAFVFSAITLNEDGTPNAIVDPDFENDVNGRIEIRGATSLDADDAFKAVKKPGDAFFKAFLVK